MNRSLRRRILISFVCLSMLLSALLGGFAHNATAHMNAIASGADPQPAGRQPALTDVSKPYAPEIFSVVGTDFTPGGRVYLAIYDQAGAQLYEHRTVQATVPLDPYRAAMLNVQGVSPVEGGSLMETFTGLCGAAAMVRAEDVSTGRWTDWLTIAPNCPANAAEIADDMNVSLRLPTANNVASAAMIAGSADGVAADPPLLFDATGAVTAPGMVTVDGQGFTAGGRVYVAIYDQMGAKLYETRWVKAYAAVTIVGASDNAPEAHPVISSSPDGRFIAAFGNISSANVMIRAYDATTETWSNWVEPNPSCAVSATHGCGSADEH
jgi:hypothetical protein